MTRKLFDDMDDKSKRFYSKVFNTAILNTYAVKRGWFEALFCETDDPMIMQKWREAVPQIALMIKVEKASGNKDFG